VLKHLGKSKRGPLSRGGDREQRASCGRDISAEEAHPSIRPSIEIYTHNFYLFIFVLSPAEEVGSAAAAWQQFRFSGFSWLRGSSTTRKICAAALVLIKQITSSA